MCEMSQSVPLVLSLLYDLCSVVILSTGCMTRRMMWTIVGAVFVWLIGPQVKGDNCPYHDELTAGSTPSITIFNQSLSETYVFKFNSRGKGMVCKWTIEASDEKKIIRLKFSTFHLMNGTHSGVGDCLSVYDENYDDSDDLIQELCDRMPAAVYNSTGSHLTVVFRQGDHGGRRWFTMNYTMVHAPHGNADHFWATTFGRVLSFIIIIAVFSIFSFVFKAWRRGDISHSSRRCCRSLGDCLQPVCRMGSRCADLFKTRAGGGVAEGSQDPPEQSRSRSHSRSRPSGREVEGAGSDIVTISGANGSAPAPNLASVFSERSSSPGGGSSRTRNVGDPPPDYSTVLASSSASTLSERSDSARFDDDAAPDYAAYAVSRSSRSGLLDDVLNGGAVTPPPPDEEYAPPSYGELPAPPSYDSLFNSSSHA